MPTSMPIATATPLATRPMTSDVRAPNSRRDRRSRPSVSVPSQYFGPGGSGAPSSDRPSNGWSSGENGASQGAAIAASDHEQDDASATRASRAAARCRRGCASSGPGLGAGGHRGPAGRLNQGGDTTAVDAERGAARLCNEKPSHARRIPKALLRLRGPATFAARIRGCKSGAAAVRAAQGSMAAGLRNGNPRVEDVQLRSKKSLAGLLKARILRDAGHRDPGRGPAAAVFCVWSIAGGRAKSTWRTDLRPDQAPGILLFAAPSVAPICASARRAITDDLSGGPSCTARLRAQPRSAGRRGVRSEKAVDAQAEVCSSTSVSAPSRRAMMARNDARRPRDVHNRWTTTKTFAKVQDLAPPRVPPAGWSMFPDRGCELSQNTMIDLDRMRLIGPDGLPKPLGADHCRANSERLTQKPWS